ncbi:alpha/beta fold hydrolase [Chloroflexota bacterium]
MGGINLEESYLDVNGIRTRYREAGSGPEVLLIHGLGSYLEHLQPTFEALADHCHVISLDLPGFGLSDKPELPYSIPFFADFIQAFMEVKEIPTTCLAGNSLGGMIAFELCLLAPERVDRLVFLAGGCFNRGLGSSLRLMTLPFVNEGILTSNREGSEMFLKLLFADPSFVTEEMVDMAHERMALPGAAKAYLATLRSAGNLLGMKREVVQRNLHHAGKIGVPALLIWGKQDKILPVVHAEIAASRMLDARLHVFDPCGHMPQIERAEEVNELVREFIIRLPED